MPAASSADATPAASTTSSDVPDSSGAALTVQSAEEATGIPASGEGTDYVAGEVLVTFRDGTTRAEATQAVQGAAAVSTGQVTEGDLVATSVEGDTLVSDTEGVAPDASAPMAKVGVADGSTVVQAVAELEQDPIVESAQPNYLYHAMDDEVGDASTLAETVAEESGTAVATQSTASINDPYFTNSSLWQLSGTYGVDAATAWNTTKCDGNVSVAIIDTGCLATHEDLAANIKATKISGVTESNSDGSFTAPTTFGDEVGHGTHVAGLVSAVSNNGKGVSGVSYNAGLVCIEANVLQNKGASSTWNCFCTDGLVNAFSYLLSKSDGDTNGDGNIGTVAEENNVRVVNMSLGGPGTTLSDGALEKQIDAACDVGIVTVCAAGNSGNGYNPPYAEYPGDYATCVSVINTTSSGVRSDSSNYNVSGTTCKNISAPGTSLLSTYNSNASSYAYLTGTSMASPVVAGIVALQFAEDPDLTPDQAKGVLYGTATDLGATGWDETYGYGRASASGVADAIIGTNDVAAADVTYSGADPTSNVTVTTASGATLAKGTDYTLAYSGHDVGSQTVTVTGTGSYSATGNQSTSTGSGYIGTVSKTFAITQAPISSASVAAIPAQEYTGLSITPSPVLTFNGTTLVEGTDYTLAYPADTTSLGSKTITITGVGNFTGTATTTYAVSRSISDAVVAATPSISTYTGSSIKPGVTVTLDGNVLSAGSDYSVSYPEDATTVGTKTITIVGAGGYAGTTTATYSIVQASIAAASVSLPSSSYTFTGGSITPTPTVVLGSKTLTKDVDFTLAYPSDTTNVGAKTITVTGKGNYTGTTSAMPAYNIVQAAISSATISGISGSYAYTGSSITPEPTVSYGGKTLAKGTDYTLAYASDSINVGSKSVTIAGVGNFAGTTTRSYLVTRPITSATVTFSPASYAYTGQAITPAPTVSVGGTALARGTDYTVSYSGDVSVGTATATVTGMGCYTGATTASYKIVARSLATATTALSPSSYVYTGSACMPTPSVKVGSATLSQGTDYSVSYADNISAGTATATMTGKGNYTGSVSKTFSIAAKSVSSATVASVPTQIYTGSALKPTPTVTLSGYGTLVAGTDYTLSYANNVGAGTATITVTGKGNFSGTRTATFKIVNPYCTDVLGAGSGKAFTIHTKLASNRLVDISGRSTANGGNAQMYAGNETPAQRFRATFVRVGSQGYGYYTFANVYSGKVLDVSGGGTTKGTNVQQWSSNGTAAQKWSLGASSTYGGYYVLTNIGSGLVLDISGNSTANGANLQIWGANGTSAQAFAFDSCQLSSSYVATGSAHAYYIHNVKNSSRVVDVSGGSAADGANIWLYDSNGTSAQSFYFSYEASTGYYLIHNTKSGKVVDVAGAGTENGSNIWQYSSNGTWAQKWSVKRNSDGTYTFFCACNGRCFDVDGGLTTNGRNIWCWDSNGTTAQRWTLEAA
ncbi:MAG: RICIN domain-containing protein [Atopobiaceae bacterium]|nr:RICIN domain-containing protein [Atopobiaceae bacterium]